ncbi:MAG: phosphonate C-P lyase system protein PhnG [Pseudomonadota bacterium]
MLSRHLDELEGTTERAAWMGVLARATVEALERLWRAHGTGASPPPLRAPETGLVMVRGRAGGTGDRFNLGEMTVTRCAVDGGEGRIGHGYVRGRSKRHALLAASFDALLQDPTRREALLTDVIAPLQATEAERRRRIAAKAAATRVEFFTMVRGQ